MASVEDEQSSSSACTFSKEEVSKQMSQGKRHFVCNEIVEAVKCFESACFMLNKKYGALSNECGDAHFEYGKSLLELARLESGVLGSAIKEADEEELPDDDGDDDNEANMETESGSGASAENSSSNKLPTSVDNSTASETNGDTAAKGSTENATGCLKEKVEGEETKTDDKLTTDSNKESMKGEERAESREEKLADTNKSNKESVSEEHKEVDETVGEDEDNVPEKDDTKVHDDSNNKADNEMEKSKDENISDDETAGDGPIPTMQLAWETLELARIIFKRHNNTDMQLKLAQTHLLLGEIHMEQEQFSDAVSELTKCLNIQKNLLKPDDRLLAETYYNLGLAYTLSMMYEESASHYENASEVLELRIKNIKTRIEEAEQQDKGKDKASNDDPVVKDRKELAELEDLLPEVKEKYLDAKNENERLKSNIKEKLGLTPFGLESSSSSTCSTSCCDKPASDISHLVKKKRKPTDEEENTADTEAPAKKPRQESEGTATQP